MNNLEEKFKELYGAAKETLEYQTKRYKNAVDTFNDIFKNRPYSIFSTPGRTELSGNHTDHNHGKVLAGSINLDSLAVVSKNNEKIVNLYSEGYPEPFIVNLKNLDPVKSEEGTTDSLIRGIAARLNELNFEVGGFNGYISSEVLPGSGLSSSASVEV